jgi:hypothetical protein
MFCVSLDSLFLGQIYIAMHGRHKTGAPTGQLVRQEQRNSQTDLRESHLNSLKSSVICSVAVANVRLRHFVGRLQHHRSDELQ